MDKFNEKKGIIIEMALNGITEKSNKIIEKIESLQKNFTELFKSDKEFFQLSFVNYTALETFRNYNACNHRVCIEDEKDIEEIIKSMNSINNELKDYIEILLNDTFSFDEYDKRSFNYFYRVGTDIGFSHISKYSRNKSREEKEEREMYENNSSSEPKCSFCGDGGCIHCEPWRFI